MEIDQRDVAFCRQINGTLERIDRAPPAIQLHKRGMDGMDRRNFLKRTDQFDRVDPLEILVDDQFEPVKPGLRPPVRRSFGAAG